MVSTAPPPPERGHDWPADIADRIESTVTTIRDKTTVPIQKAAAVVVYGLVAATVGAVALVLLIVMVLRLHVYLPYHPEGRRVWTTDVALGAIFVAAGGLCWRRRSVTPREST